MVRTHISEKFQEIFTQHEAHNTEPSQTFFSKTGTDLIPRTDLRQRDKAGVLSCHKLKETYFKSSIYFLIL